jgi:hypothetical protein
MVMTDPGLANVGHEQDITTSALASAHHSRNAIVGDRIENQPAVFVWDPVALIWSTGNSIASRANVRSVDKEIVLSDLGSRDWDDDIEFVLARRPLVLTSERRLQLIRNLDLEVFVFGTVQRSGSDYAFLRRPAGARR